MSQARDGVSALRTALARFDPAADLMATDLVPFGLPSLDEGLGGGVRRGAMHEVYAAESEGHEVASAGFGLGMALRASRGGAFAWIRQDEADAAVGRLHGAGLAAFGANPACLTLVRVADAEGLFRAARDALRCSGLGAVLAEAWGTSRSLDLTASRRLALAASQSGVTLVMVRLGAAPAPSAAMTRWSVAAAASTPLEANAPGRPAFAVTLLRHRAGTPGGTWHLEWDRDRAVFAEPAPLPRPVVSVPARRAAGARDEAAWRRAV
ncbi:MAG TPA: hypothetical protein VIL65_08060 [Beijerinckiaceae bacterium]|jgi:protein ImuA